MNGPAEAVSAARAAQTAWGATPIVDRLRVLRAVRDDIAERPDAWGEAITPPQDRTLAESLAAEVGPLADALRWLERRAARTLRHRSEGRWPGSVRLRVARKPLGVVLVIGASNYPLFLLAVPAAQALAAGNAVVLKPPPGGEAAAAIFQRALLHGGLDPLLCPVLDASAEAAQGAIDAGVDHLVFTGSAETGAAVGERAARWLTPSTMECSGSDAVVVLPGVDIDRVAHCVAWGLSFNSGASCIGPRRLITVGDGDGKVRKRVVEAVSALPLRRLPARAARDAAAVLTAELAAGADIACPQGLDAEAIHRWGEAGELPPVVLTSARSPSAVSQADVFAPVLTLDEVIADDEAVALANGSPFALGAAVFGPRADAERVARRLRAGCVTVNDVIAPTADPRTPFGGAGRSGYGVTRGPEGLLAMTRPQAVVTRRGRWLPHLDEENSGKPNLIAGLIQASHGDGLAARWRGVRRLLDAVREK